MAYRNITRTSLTNASREDIYWFLTFTKKLPVKYYDELEKLFSEGLKRGYRNSVVDKLNGKVINEPKTNVKKIREQKYPFGKLKVSESFWWKKPEDRTFKSFQTNLSARSIAWGKKYNKLAKFSTKTDMTGITVTRIK